MAVAVLAAVVLVLPNFSLASFGGQNGKVFYEKDGEIWSVNSDGTDAVDLTPGNTTSSEQRPSPSADGQHVVFQVAHAEAWNIFSMNADGSNQVDLTNNSAPVANLEPSFSPDGSKVVFMRRGLPAGEQDIWVMDANGSGAVDLTNSPGLNETAPEFSPDGTRIVYISSDPTSSGAVMNGHEFSNDIWVMNANGSSAKQLTESNSMIHYVAPAWSPDSTKIAYSTVECPPPVPPAEPPTCGKPTASGLHVMNADGTEKTLLLNEGKQIRSGQLSWSPDGTRIAFDSWIAGGIISTVEATGGAPTILVANTGARYPSWAPVPTDTGEGPPPGTPPESPSPGGIAGTPPLVTPAHLPARKPLKCGKGKKKKVFKGKVKCVRKHKFKK